MGIHKLSQTESTHLQPLVYLLFFYIEDCAHQVGYRLRIEVLLYQKSRSFLGNGGSSEPTEPPPPLPTGLVKVSVIKLM